MIVRIAGVNENKVRKQIELLKKWLISQGKEVFVSEPCTEEAKKDFLRFIKGQDETFVMFALQALHSRQQREAKRALAKGKIVITGEWSGFCSAWRFDCDLEKRHAFSWPEEVCFAEPLINFLLKLKRNKKDSLMDFVVPVTKERWQETLVHLSNIKPEAKKWKVICGSLNGEEIHKEIKAKILQTPWIRKGLQL